MQHRTSHGAQVANRFEGGRLFLAALLLALASALVPALFPAHGPMGRVAGSAFDPTTSTVTLRGRDDGAMHIIVSAQTDDGPIAPPLYPSALPTSAITASAAATRPEPGTHDRLDATPHPALRRFALAQPRAPPALIL